MLAEMIGYEGEIAILSAGATMTNQNTWIEWMKKELEDPKYPRCRWWPSFMAMTTARRASTKLRVLQVLPEFQGYYLPTTVGIAATGKALTDAGLCGKVALTAWGYPARWPSTSRAACLHGNGLWNPRDQGYLSTYIAHYLADGTLTPKAGETFKAGRMGDFTVVEVAPGDLQVYQDRLSSSTPKTLTSGLASTRPPLI